MAAKKGKATAGAAPEKQAQGETYKGFSLKKDGPVTFSDELRAEIDAFHDLDPTDNEEVREKIEARGLEYDGEERAYIQNMVGDPEDLHGWKGRGAGAVFTNDEADGIYDLIGDWITADETAAADLEAVLIARGLERPADYAERRARHAIEGHYGYAVISEHDTKKGKAVTLGYRAEKGTQKTATLPTLVEVLAAVRMLEGVAPPPQPAATSAPVDELKAHVWTGQQKRDLAAMRREALQVAAVAVRFVKMIDGGRGRA